MWDWFTAAQTVHAFLLVLAAIGAFRFAIGTRFWFPRYIHYLAAFASVLGLTCLTFIPADAPINQSEWGGLKKGLLVLVFPGLVYFFFVFHGGQRVAYERTHQPEAMLCPYCRSPQAGPGSRCSHCGQTLSR